jgi:exopolysaccharide biosynthesis polyprenyl glycosylphosphotransferase
MLRRGSLNFTLIAFVLDVLCAIEALSLASRLRILFPIDEPDLLSVDLPVPMIMLTILIWTAVFVILSVYDDQLACRFVDEAQRVIGASLFAMLVLAGALYFSYRDVPRLFMIYFFAVNVTLLVGWRVLARWGSRNVTHTYRERNVLVVGANEVGKLVTETIQRYRSYGLRLLGFVDNHQDSPVANLSILGSIPDIRRIVEENQVDEVVVALPYGEYDELGSVVRDLQSLPVHVRIIPNYLNLALHRASVESFGGLPLINLREPALTRYQRLVKRVFDIICSLVLIILALPVMSMVAVAIKLDSPGPVLFKQKRVGENGMLFTMYKFRSMVVDADKRQTEVTKITQTGEIIHKSKQDPRITRVGRLIRSSSLDELPQLFNVFFGDMSLVGPRPELPWLVEKYEPWQHKRLAVPQGITGWWQVNGRSDKPLHLNTEDDLYYVQHYSLLLDLRILWKTFAVVLKREGAY